MRKVTITLHSDGMIGATREDFAAWYHFVADQIDARTGLDVTVDMARFGDAGNDVPRWYDDEIGDALRDALRALWDEFCSDPGKWPNVGGET